jgi:hypothetical protein
MAENEAGAGSQPGGNSCPPVHPATAAPNSNASKQDPTAVGRLVKLHRWMSADDKRWLLERFPEPEATLAHLDRCDDQIALLTIGTATEDRGSVRATSALSNGRLGSHENGEPGPSGFGEVGRPHVVVVRVAPPNAGALSRDAPRPTVHSATSLSGNGYGDRVSR